MANATQYTGAQSALFAPLTAWVHSVRERLICHRNYRRTFNELSALSSPQLADLGLHRSTLRAAAYRATYHQFT